MTVSSRRSRGLLIFILPTIIGIAFGIWLAEKKHHSLQDRWSTNWLVKEMERVVPSYWVGADETAYLGEINNSYEKAAEYWTPYRAIAGTNLVSVTREIRAKPSGNLRGYPLSLPEGAAIVTIESPPFLGDTEREITLVAVILFCMVLVWLAIKFLPKPYSSLQKKAINAGLPLNALSDSRIAKIFDREIRLPLLTELLKTQHSDPQVVALTCSNESAAKLAQQCINNKWVIADIYKLLRDALEASRFPESTGLHYEWWKLLVTKHGILPLDALIESEKPRLMTLDIDRRTIEIKGISGRIPPKSFALLVYFALKKNANKEPLARPSKAGDEILTEELASIYADLPGSANKKDIFTTPITGEELGQMNAHLNTSIKNLVEDDNLAAFYEVQSEGIKHGEKSYQLMCSVNIISSV